ncbi:hypothetical protein BaRGS_00028399 [Batillaria attramentaria]|uniref:Uncharacterized protein n=1 Tax=Batillaria attramentaria TaxID=370345 RepID=A0ABD0JZ58_9CAEN
MLGVSLFFKREAGKDSGPNSNLLGIFLLLYFHQLHFNIAADAQRLLRCLEPCDPGVGLGCVVVDLDVLCHKDGVHVLRMSVASSRKPCGSRVLGGNF